MVDAFVAGQTVDNYRHAMDSSCNGNNIIMEKYNGKAVSIWLVDTKGNGYM